MEQLRKELKKWEGEGKAKKTDIGDTDEYQVRAICAADRCLSLILPSDSTSEISLSLLRKRGEVGRPNRRYPGEEKGIVPRSRSPWIQLRSTKHVPRTLLAGYVYIVFP
jgi:hypothetical protein